MGPLSLQGKLQMGDCMALPKQMMQSVRGSGLRVEHRGTLMFKGRQELHEEDSVGTSWGRQQQPESAGCGIEGEETMSGGPRF